MKKQERKEQILLLTVVGVAILIFSVLYFKNQIPKEKVIVEVNVTEENPWTLENSVMNNQPLEEDKSIYPDEPDVSIHDVYISVFPTKDENGEIIDFSAFGKHQARDHSYNPVLNCNIQILDENEMLDPLVSLDTKNATIRVRGNSSRGDVMKSYRIKLDEEAGTFNGQDSLNLNKHVEDMSKVTTKFCTDLLTDVEHMISYQTNFMRVWIRDTSKSKEEQEFEYYGLFTHTEQPNKSFLEKRGLPTECSMYKARDFSFNLDSRLKNVDDLSYLEEEFESVLGIREGNDHTKLLEMVQAINDENQDFETVFNKYFNEENYLTWLAFSLLVGADDILNHNYILYSPNASSTWYFFPWDFDSNMVFGEKASSSLVPSIKGGQKLNQSILHRRYFRVPGNLEKIQKKMEYLMENYFTEANIERLVQAYIPVMERTLFQMPDIGLLRISPEKLIPYTKAFYEGIQENYQNFLYAFQFPAPMFVSMPIRDVDGTLNLSWDTSYSYQGRPITYNVTIANDYNMKQVLFKQEGIIDNRLDAQIDLSPGTYYLLVTAVDSEGNEQVSMEHYEFAGKEFIYKSGVLEFTIE